ncbi:MAG: 50S ribosomal protein L23 [Candidatus Hodarchaeales archaeon]|jgi:large subunit ribosomal protein L23Ae
MKFDHPQDIIKYPLITESAFNKMDSIYENALVFIVDRRATKHQIKFAFESLYKVSVVKVNTLITPQGKKKAFIKLLPENSALDLATEVGII